MSSTYKSLIKKLLFAIAPGYSERLFLRRQHKHVEALESRLGLKSLAQRYVEMHGSIVRHGPFTGMRYLSESTGSTLIPKLLGCYELEIHPFIERLPGLGIARVIDIGCAEGYYAAGLARMLPGVEVHGFDLDQRALDLCTKLCAINGVADRVQLSGRCDPPALERLLVPRSLVVCDCEGAEWLLLDPTAVPSLRHSFILVELHPVKHFVSDVEISRRFSATHHVEICSMTSRVADQYSELETFSPAERNLAVNELRGSKQEWAFLSPLVNAAVAQGGRAT